MDRIAKTTDKLSDEEIDLMKKTHEMMAFTLKSIIDRLSGKK